MICTKFYWICPKCACILSKYDWIYTKYDLICPYTTIFVLYMTEFVLHLSGVVLNMDRFDDDDELNGIAYMTVLTVSCCLNGFHQEVWHQMLCLVFYMDLSLKNCHESDQ